MGNLRKRFLDNTLLIGKYKVQEKEPEELESQDVTFSPQKAAAKLDHDDPYLSEEKEPGGNQGVEVRSAHVVEPSSAKAPVSDEKGREPAATEADLEHDMNRWVEMVDGG